MGVLPEYVCELPFSKVLLFHFIVFTCYFTFVLDCNGLWFYVVESKRPDIPRPSIYRVPCGFMHDLSIFYSSFISNGYQKQLTPSFSPCT